MHRGLPAQAIASLKPVVRDPGGMLRRWSSGHRRCSCSDGSAKATCSTACWRRRATAAAACWRCTASRASARPRCSIMWSRRGGLSDRPHGRSRRGDGARIRGAPAAVLAEPRPHRAPSRSPARRVCASAPPPSGMRGMGAGGSPGQLECTRAQVVMGPARTKAGIRTASNPRCLRLPTTARRSGFAQEISVSADAGAVRAGDASSASTRWDPYRHRLGKRWQATSRSE
jgi:hypothetical protein